MAKTWKDFNEEYKGYSPEEKRTVRRQAIFWAAIILIPVIFGIALAFGAFPFYE